MVGSGLGGLVTICWAALFMVDPTIAGWRAGCSMCYGFTYVVMAGVFYGVAFATESSASTKLGFINGFAFVMSIW